MNLLFLVAYLNLFLFKEVSFDKKNYTNNIISIYGNCFDIITGVSLNVKAKVLIKSGNSILINSDMSGVLDFKIPSSATAIIFESSGYRSEVVPIHPIAPYNNDQKFFISIPMSRIDSTPIYQKNLLSLTFLVIDNVEVNYKISLKKNSEHFLGYTYSPNLSPKNLILEMNDKLGEYLLTATLDNGELLFTEEIFINKGINFKSILVKEGKLNTAKNENISNLTIGNKLLVMFKQSEYYLSDSSKTILDSVSTILLNNPILEIRITGHTDNVGKEKLNLYLSEYRARVVAQYLLYKGIRVNQINLDWKGSEFPIFPNDIENNKKNNRRVELKISEM